MCKYYFISSFDLSPLYSAAHFNSFTTIQYFYNYFNFKTVSAGAGEAPGDVSELETSQEQVSTDEIFEK